MYKIHDIQIFVQWREAISKGKSSEQATSAQGFERSPQSLDLPVIRVRLC